MQPIALHDSISMAKLNTMLVIALRDGLCVAFNFQQNGQSGRTVDRRRHRHRSNEFNRSLLLHNIDIVPSVCVCVSKV